MVLIKAISKAFKLLAVACCLLDNVSAQAPDILQYVNPFIGTAKSSSFTKWGSEGGTFPGAVAPSGYLQLSPETNAATTKGYNYADSAILYFSCLYHSSGFPNGSAGRLQVMPVNKDAPAKPRPFTHTNEAASPGYYKVIFSDDYTLVEATASERTGMFRFTFPKGVMPRILISDAGTISFPSDKILHGTAFNAVLNFSTPFTNKQVSNDGVALSFAADISGPTIISLKVSASVVSVESAQKNMDTEAAKGFDDMLQNTQQKWRQHLSVVEIADSNTANKQKFYTALYHSLLIPWIVSDIDGIYRGADGQVHKTKGQAEYGHFSPWDTYRTLHPMLSLLYPQKQAGILLSMMDIYNEGGHLPTESMTGNHAIPIIADAYLKGIKSIDSLAAYKAMNKSIVTGPFVQQDMGLYNQLGYVPFTHPESVTRTVEYAYDDWALAQFCRKVFKRQKPYGALLDKSNNYRNLFNGQDLFFIPRFKDTFKTEPGTMGYKEGDKWVYTYAIQHNIQDAINLLGGNDEFASRLNAALENGELVFDNETVFHVPYLFNIAGHPELTQKWVSKIIKESFAATPGGLPGNDDLGSTSSWLVLSAMGIYPLCPGITDYTITSPLFKSLTLHLANKRDFTIQQANDATGKPYISSLFLNGLPLKQLYVPHHLILQGGKMVFKVTASPNNTWFSKKQKNNFSETKETPDFKISNCMVAKQKVVPDETVWVKFSIKNKGAKGTKIIKLFIGAKIYNTKNCLVDTNETITDSISCKLYKEGKINASVNGIFVAEMNVVKPPYPYPGQPAITSLSVQSTVKANSFLQYSFYAQNTGGSLRSFYIPILLDNVLVHTDTLQLYPGEKRMLSKKMNVSVEGWQELRIATAAQKFKVYGVNKDALVLNLSLVGSAVNNAVIADSAGFGNKGLLLQEQKGPLATGNILLNKNCFVEVPNSYSLDHLDSTITMMAWVYQKDISMGLTDLFTKGDNHVLQVVDGRQLSFFAGGWGRGDCTVPLPGNWVNNWHHITGVCTGKTLFLYIDGKLSGTTQLTETANLSNQNKWVIGRNEEFPSQRIFTGYMDKVKVYTTALSEKEVNESMMETGPFKN